MGKSDLSSAIFLCLRSSWVIFHHLGRWFSTTELSLLPPAIPEKGKRPLEYSLVSHLLTCTWASRGGGVLTTCCVSSHAGR